MPDTVVAWILHVQHIDVFLVSLLLVPFAQFGISIYLNVLCNYALISTFILRKLAVERGVHFYTTVSFYSVSHTLEHFLSRFPKTVAAQCNPL